MQCLEGLFGYSRSVRRMACFNDIVERVNFSRRRFLPAQEHYILNLNAMGQDFFCRGSWYLSSTYVGLCPYAFVHVSSLLSIMPIQGHPRSPSTISLLYLRPNRCDHLLPSCNSCSLRLRFQFVLDHHLILSRGRLNRFRIHRH
jgi:hypothetical protein